MTEKLLTGTLNLNKTNTNLTSLLRQNEQHEQIEIIANHGSLCKRVIMIKKTSSNQPCERDSECKMVRF